MTFFLTYDISFFSVAMLLVLYITIKLKRDTFSTSSRLFQKMIWINIFMLLTEVASWQYDGLPGHFNWYANYISNMLFAWSTPLITCVWTSYIDYHMFHSYDRLKRRWFYMQPMIVNTVFIMINLFTPFIFSVSADNIYSREPFMWLIIVVNSTVVIYKWIDAYLNRDKINREIVIAMLIYILLPAVAAGIQVAVYGAFIIWPTMAITIIISYIYLETISTSRDYLTRLMMRHRVDDHVEYLIQTGKTFGLAIFDLNNFKAINDEHGHLYGDKALRLFADALTQTFSEVKIIGRFGGDEFILVTEACDEACFEERCNTTLRNQIDLLTSGNALPFNIRYSVGYHTYEPDSNLTYEALLHIADQKMYADKHSEDISQLHQPGNLL